MALEVGRSIDFETIRETEIPLSQTRDAGKFYLLGSRALTYSRAALTIFALWVARGACPIDEILPPLLGALPAGSSIAVGDTEQAVMIRKPSDSRSQHTDSARRENQIYISLTFLPGKTSSYQIQISR